MTRSLKKGPYVDEKLLRKLAAVTSGTVVRTWSRASQIAPEMVGRVVGVHNGKDFVEVLITEDMVGHRLGEFSPTRKFVRHGGKMQRALDKGAQTAEPA